MSEQNHQRLRVLAKQLPETHMAAALCAKEISAEIQAEMQKDRTVQSGQLAEPVGSDQRQQRPVLDESRLCVIWRDRMLHLGYTISYRILDYLARRPNRYVRQLDMIHEIWEDDQLEFSTVRSSVRHLRKRLQNGWMHRGSQGRIGRCGTSVGLMPEHRGSRCIHALGGFSVLNVTENCCWLGF